MFEQILFVFKPFAKFRKMTVASSYVSALSSAGVEQRIFMNLDDWVFFECVEEMEVSLEYYKNNRYFTRNIITGVISMGGFTVKLIKFKLHF